MADAYLQFFQQNPEYYRLLMAFDRGQFQATISIPASIRKSTRAACTASNGWSALSSRRKPKDLITVENPREAAGVLWAGLNGVLVLLSHPLRAEIHRDGSGIVVRHDDGSVDRRVGEVGGTMQRKSNPLPTVICIIRRVFRYLKTFGRSAGVDAESERIHVTERIRCNSALLLEELIIARPIRLTTMPDQRANNSAVMLGTNAVRVRS